MAASTEPAGAGAHTPVLYHQVLSALEPRAGGRYIDATVGTGGHAFGILSASAPDGELLGLDRDPTALDQAGDRLEAFGSRLHLRHGSFAEMAAHVISLGWDRVDGVLLDLGMSSMQLEDPDRGFSFRTEGPLDMRFDPAQSITAADLVNESSEEALRGLIFRYGEERRARRIAQAIVAARPLHTTVELAEVIARVAGGRRTRTHPARRTFQALRIAVNGELDALEVALEQVPDLLESGGRLVVIAFHSLEDRIVKRFIQRESRDCVCPPEQVLCTCGHRASLASVFRRPVQPDQEELKANPRARSARMRVAERLALA